MIQGFWDAFRLDEMVVWYFTTPSASPFVLLLVGMVLAIRFHESRFAGAATSLPLSTRIAWRLLRFGEFTVLVWVYWINAEFADLDFGQRAALFVVAFLSLYNLVLTLHAARGSTAEAADRGPPDAS